MVVTCGDWKGSSSLPKWFPLFALRVVPIFRRCSLCEATRLRVLILSFVARSDPDAAVKRVASNVWCGGRECGRVAVEVDPCAAWWAQEPPCFEEEQQLKCIMDSSSSWSWEVTMQSHE